MLVNESIGAPYEDHGEEHDPRMEKRAEKHGRRKAGHARQKKEDVLRRKRRRYDREADYFRSKGKPLGERKEKIRVVDNLRKKRKVKGKERDESQTPPRFDINAPNVANNPDRPRKERVSASGGERKVMERGRQMREERKEPRRPPRSDVTAPNVEEPQQDSENQWRRREAASEEELKGAITLLLDAYRGRGHRENEGVTPKL